MKKLGKKLFFLGLCENMYKTRSKVSWAVTLVMLCMRFYTKKRLIKWSLSKHEKERAAVDLLPYIESFLLLSRSEDWCLYKN